jgi:hypothetical protein
MTEPEQILQDCPLLPSASSQIACSLEVDAVFTDILKTICETTDWEYGEVWTVIADSRILEISSAWYTRTQLSSDRIIDWEHFHACSQEFVLRPDEGLPGRVWASQRSEWIVDVSGESESYFLRNQIAKAFGVKSGFGVPVSIGQFQAVLVFFMSEARGEDLQLIELTQGAVAHLKSQLPRF